MPLFDYQCDKCNRVFEKLVSSTGSRDNVYCCGTFAGRLPSAPGMFRIRGYNANNGYSVPKESDFDDSNVPESAAQRVQWEQQGRIPTPDQYTRE